MRKTILVLLLAVTLLGCAGGKPPREPPPLVPSVAKEPHPADAPAPRGHFQSGSPSPAGGAGGCVAGEPPDSGVDRAASAG
jgi:hypothetical protein